MKSVKLICPKCKKETIVENDLVKALMDTGGKCPECDCVGMERIITFDGFDGEMKLDSDVACDAYTHPDNFPERSNVLAEIMYTVKETAKRSRIAYIALHKKGENGWLCNVLRTYNVELLEWMDEQDTAYFEEYADELLSAKPFSIVDLTVNFSIKSKKRKEKAVEAKSADGIESEQKFAYVISAWNAFERKPAFIGISESNIVPVTSIANAAAFRKKDKVEETLAKVKEAFGSAYKEYKIEPISLGIVRSIVRSPLR